MLNIDAWMDLLCQKLQETFGGRLRFVGLQGSYGRGEANEDSDIDPVVILDQVDAQTLKTYRALLDEMPEREKCCGFIGGWEELHCWDGADLFQLYHDTTPILGSMDDLLPILDQAAVRRAIHLGACNIYHICAHNTLHGCRRETVRSQLKAAAFTLQALHYDRTGMFVRKQQELLSFLPEKDRRVLEMSLAAKRCDVAFEEQWESWSMYLFEWAKALICQYGQ